MYDRKLHLFAKTTAIATFFLIIAGGLVTSTGSALSVPDWPLSYGQYFPPMIGGIRFEHTHRVVAGTVGILTLGLMIFFFIREKRAWVSGLGALAFLMVVAQAALGALTVKYLLPTPISVAHACLGQTFFTLLCLLTLFTSREWLEADMVSFKKAAGLRRLLLTTLFFVYLQLILGATIRHTAQHTGLNYHFFCAFLIVVHIIFIIPKCAKEGGVRRYFLKPVMLLATLAVTQIFLGLGSYIYKIIMTPAEMPRTAEVLFTTAHQTNGALILATTALLSVRAFRLLRPAA